MIKLFQVIFHGLNHQIPTVKFGTQNKTLGFEYFSEFQDSVFLELKTAPVELGTYLKMKYNFNDVLILEPGIRINYYNVFPDSLYPDLRFD